MRISPKPNGLSVRFAQKSLDYNFGICLIFSCFLLFPPVFILIILFNIIESTLSRKWTFSHRDHRSTIVILVPYHLGLPTLSVQGGTYTKNSIKYVKMKAFALLCLPSAAAHRQYPHVRHHVIMFGPWRTLAARIHSWFEARLLIHRLWIA